MDQQTELAKHRQRFGLGMHHSKASGIIAKLVLVYSCRHIARTICLHVEPAKDLSAAQLFHRCATKMLTVIMLRAASFHP